MFYGIYRHDEDCDRGVVKIGHYEARRVPDEIIRNGKNSLFTSLEGAICEAWQLHQDELQRAI
jgi:hypothetical protein